MAQKKTKKQSISLDMTAMCDVAFLLLTFFMLTAKFKPPEAVAVDMPSSHSNIKLPEENMMLISVDKEGTVFFGVLGQEVKKQTLKAMTNKYQVNLTEEEYKEFQMKESIGVPMKALKSILNMSADELKNADFPGIPVDSADNQLQDWIKAAYAANKQVKGENIRIAVKGDKDVSYNRMKRIIDILQEQNINKFNLITTLEGGE